MSIPVLFQSDDGDVPGIYLSQLYLGSIVPEGSALPMLLGQIGAGYPKRDAIFTVNGFGDKTAEVKFERWGKPIVDMKYEMGEELTDLSNLPFGSDLSDLTAFLHKAIPASDGTGWDVLQITTPVSQTQNIARVNKAEASFTGDLVLDLDLSRFDAAPLIAFTATKETDYGTETDGRIPPRCGAYCADQWADAQAGG